MNEDLEPRYFVLHCPADDSHILVTEDVVICEESASVGSSILVHWHKDLVKGTIKGISKDYDEMRALQDKLNSATKPKRELSFHGNEKRRAAKKCIEKGFMSTAGTGAPSNSSNSSNRSAKGKPAKPTSVLAKLISKADLSASDSCNTSSDYDPDTSNNSPIPGATGSTDGKTNAVASQDDLATDVDDSVTSDDELTAEELAVLEKLKRKKKAQDMSSLFYLAKKKPRADQLSFCVESDDLFMTTAAEKSGSGSKSVHSAVSVKSFGMEPNLRANRKDNSDSDKGKKREITQCTGLNGTKLKDKKDSMLPTGSPLDADPEKISNRKSLEKNSSSKGIRKDKELSNGSDSDTDEDVKLGNLKRKLMGNKSNPKEKKQDRLVTSDGNGSDSDQRSKQEIPKFISKRKMAAAGKRKCIKMSFDGEHFACNPAKDTQAVKLHSKHEVYVNSDDLKEVKRKNHTPTALARALTRKVFTKEARLACSVGGKPSTGRNGVVEIRTALKRDGVNAILDFITKRAETKSMAPVNETLMKLSMGNMLCEDRAAERLRNEFEQEVQD